MKKIESEFGKGFVYPLTLFALHFERGDLLKQIHSDKPINKYFEISLSIYKTMDKVISSEIKIFFNGASDHLYELQIPKEFRRKNLGKLAKKLQDKALEIGHGFNGKDYTKEDFFECYKWLKEIMFLIDKELGLKPIKANFS